MDFFTMSPEEQEALLRRLNDNSSQNSTKTFADLAHHGYGFLEDTTAAIPGVVGLAGFGIQKGLDAFAPGFTDPQRVENEKQMRNLAAESRARSARALLGLSVGAAT